MSKPIIQLQNVSKDFGTFRALHGITFDIGHGEFFSLLGASGCGKTTLLRILAGIEDPTQGQLLIDGQPMKGIPPNKRPTNMVFQSYAIFPHLSVAENVGYGLPYLNVSKAEAKTRVADALAMVKLTGLDDRSANQLSGGQRQRVALARALVCRPKVLLLDEPLSALDKKLREEMQHELRALQRTVGITFVFVTHDQEEALTLSDRIAVMSGGKVLQIDTPDGLYTRPASREVAGFIGTMNFFPGKVAVQSPDGVTVDAGPLGPLVAIGSGAVVGQPADIAVRPEKIRLQPAGEGQLRGKVRSIAYLGDRSHLLVDIDGLDTPVTVFSSNAEGERASVSVGDPVGLSWDTAAARLLTA